MSVAPTEKSANGISLVAVATPVPKKDAMHLALMLEAVDEVKGMTSANRLALYGRLDALGRELHTTYDAQLAKIQASLVPSHMSWPKFKRDLLRLDAALINENLWLGKRS